MQITHFNDLLAAAAQQPDPQRLLFVFVTVELPEGSSAEQRSRFEAGQGGALVPLMCADKSPEELDSFDTLLREADQLGPGWRFVFCGALGGRGEAPTTKDADVPLQRMVEAIKGGQLDSMVPFDRTGQVVSFG